MRLMGARFPIPEYDRHGPRARTAPAWCSGTRAPSALAIASRLKVVTVRHRRSQSPVSAIDPHKTNRVTRIPFTALADPDNRTMLSRSFGWQVPALFSSGQSCGGPRARSSPRCSPLEVGNGRGLLPTRSILTMRGRGPDQLLGRQSPPEPLFPDSSMPLAYSVGISSNGHRFVIVGESDAGSVTSVSLCTTRSSMPAWA